MAASPLKPTARQVHTRVATTHDLDGIGRLTKANSRQLGFVMRVALEQAMSHQEVLVATWADAPTHILGFVHFTLRKRDPQVTLHEICTDATVRGSGMGRALVDALVALARPRGYTRIVLKCLVDNTPANAFYAHLGFVQTGTDPGKKRPLLIWTLALTPDATRVATASASKAALPAARKDVRVPARVAKPAADAEDDQDHADQDDREDDPGVVDSDLTDVVNRIIPIAAITPHPRNYRKHPDTQIARLRASDGRFGQVRSIVVQEGAPGRYLLVAGEGYVTARKANHKRYTRADVVPASWSDDQIMGYLLADNLHSNGAEDDGDLLGQLLREQEDAGYDLETVGTSHDELEAMLDDLADSQLTPDGDDVPQPEKGRQPNPRNLAIDGIITLAGKGGLCCAATHAGLKFGVQSNGALQTGYCAIAQSMPNGRHRVVFVDNDYREYDHAAHCQFIRDLGYQPKYATTRDIMTRHQCDEAGIPYFPLEQILDFAAELEALAQQVILIPKYDCLDQIPTQYVLGYSIPTSHGGTPLPAEAFKGRPVHLLGGSWGKQLAYLAVLGDDVVSLDNNYVCKQAQFGQFVDPDGHNHHLSDLAPAVTNVTNPLLICLTISYGAIAEKLRQLTAGVEGVDSDRFVEEFDTSGLGSHDVDEDDAEDGGED